MAAKSKDSNLFGALSYLLGPLTGVIFFVIKNDDKFVRYHSLQSIVFFVAMWVLQFILAITIIGAILVPLVWLVNFLAWLFSMYKAYKGEMHELPVVGKIVKTM